MDRRNFIKVTAAGVVATTVSCDNTSNTAASDVPAKPAAATTQKETSGVPRAERIGFSTAITPPQESFGDLKFSDAEYERRYTRIRELMDEQGVDALIVTGNQGWFGGEESNLFYVAGTGTQLAPPVFLLPKQGTPVFLSENPGMLVRAQNDMPGIIDAMPSARQTKGILPDHATKLAEFIKKFGYEKSTIGLVSYRIFPIELYEGLRKELPNATFVDADLVLSRARLVKSEEEINFLHRSGHCADKGIEAIINMAQVGVTEKELLIECDAAMTKEGHRMGAFNLLGSHQWKEGLGRDGTIYMGSDRKLRKGDLIFTELTSVYKGYYTQLCVPMSLGDPDEHFLKYLEINKKIYDLGFKLYRPGTTTGKINKAGRDLCAELNDELFCPFICQPVDFERSFHQEDNPVSVGVAYILHPWVMRKNRKGYVGHNIGNTVVCTEGEPILVNRAPQDLVIIS